jgi:hypothetical protein
MLAVALDLADSALRIEHPRLDLEPPHTGQLPPPTELLADCCWRASLNCNPSSLATTRPLIMPSTHGISI